jgi:uncharacterized membrane protein YtjA (UPF0391 family)
MTLQKIGPGRSGRGIVLCSRVVAREVETMLYTLAVILLIAWLLGVVGTYTIGGIVHVLLVIALVLFVVGLLTGRRTVV